jgi:hypothetical protein
LTASDLLTALLPVAEALEAANVPYYVGGSVASSAHGIPRTSIDADLIADLQAAHVGPFVARLQGGFYLDEDRVRAAVQTRRSFNLIHLATMFKVDVFVARRRPYDLEALRRARPMSLEGAGVIRPFPVASAEDSVLAKIEWFRAGGEASERQWTDIVGVLKTLGGQADVAYLRKWATALDVRDLLDRAERDAAADSTG